MRVYYFFITVIIIISFYFIDVCSINIYYMWGASQVYSKHWINIWKKGLIVFFWRIFNDFLTPNKIGYSLLPFLYPLESDASSVIHSPSFSTVILWSNHVNKSQTAHVCRIKIRLMYMVMTILSNLSFLWLFSLGVIHDYYGT
jgi:hypothetical protein